MQWPLKGKIEIGIGVDGLGQDRTKLGLIHGRGQGGGQGRVE